jgi:hypothetical protein
MAHSVHDRLLALAKVRSRPFNELLQYYAMERFLYRLSVSTAKRRFVLKGALLLTAHGAAPFRPTRDIDLLGGFDNSEATVRELLGAVCRQEVPDDGLRFDAESLRTERIREDADYPGVRSQFAGNLGRARVAMQVDVGFGDAVTPAPREIVYPALLDQPAPRLRAYPLETAVAEKLQTMVYLGELNSRMKDFFDVWFLCRHPALESERLRAAIAATFARRRTAVPATAECFSTPFAAAKQTQWGALLRKTPNVDIPQDLVTVIRDIRNVVEPLFRELQTGNAHAKLHLRGPDRDCPGAEAVASARVRRARLPYGGPGRPERRVRPERQAAETGTF